MTNSTKIIVAIVLSVCVTAFAVSCNPAPKPVDCQRFRSGRFEMYHEETGSTILVTREGNQQKEIVQGKTDTEYHDVKWVSDCHYELHYLGGKLGIADSVTRYFQTHPIKVDVIKTGKDYYIYSSQLEGVDRKHTDTLYITQ